MNIYGPHPQMHECVSQEQVENESFISANTANIVDSFAYLVYIFAQNSKQFVES